MLFTWFVDVDMAVHHARHEDQVPHILNPKAGALMKQLRFQYLDMEKSEVSTVLEGGRNRRQSCITSEDRLYVGGCQSRYA
jgi:hypothetical protein